MKYAYFKRETNKIIGFYDDEIHEAIPKPNIKISDDEWLEALAIGANTIKDGKMIYVQPKIDEKTRELAELEEQIKETESYIRHAILIGNDSALPELREEYKELLAQKQALEKENR
ncbi:hypothetical protein [Campylobacter concisus]|uniref:hypothetical protein n=1 Tax=Campylobacter concisus TaxID=199 RepID=UPI000CD850AA|nr:hypothetical protein [Campylobacter concisus]